MSDTPLPNNLPSDLRAYLDSVPPVTAEMTERVAAANRALENDPTFQADHLRDVIHEKNAEISALRADVCFFSLQGQGGQQMSASTGLTFKGSTPSRDITFAVGTSNDSLKLDKDGFVYMGQRINDAGEAHRLFIRVMQNRDLFAELNAANEEIARLGDELAAQQEASK